MRIYISILLMILFCAVRAQNVPVYTFPPDSYSQTPASDTYTVASQKILLEDGFKYGGSVGSTKLFNLSISSYNTLTSVSGAVITQNYIDPTSNLFTGFSNDIVY